MSMENIMLISLHAIGEDAFLPLSASDMPGAFAPAATDPVTLDQPPAAQPDLR
jgi:hypothetical protein